MERILMKGNEALAEAAIRAGCKCYFGYPITPQTEIAAYMRYSECAKGRSGLRRHTAGAVRLLAGCKIGRSRRFQNDCFCS